MSIDFFPFTPLLKKRKVKDISKRYSAICSSLYGYDNISENVYRLGILDYLTLGLYPVSNKLYEWGYTYREEQNSCISKLGLVASYSYPIFLVLNVLLSAVKAIISLILSVPLTALLTTYKATEYALNHTFDEVMESICNP